MPRIQEIAKSRFLKKEDVGNGLLLTVTKWSQENVALENEPAEMKYCLHFEENDKPLVLNSTNAQLIASFLHSDEIEDWVGKQIVLYNDPSIQMAGRMTGGIRARAPRIRQQAPQGIAPTTPMPKPKPRPAPAPAPNPQPELGEDPPEGDEVPF